MKRLLPFLLLCAVSLAVQADPARVIRATELKAKPFSDAATLAPLAANVTVDVLKRDGGWYQVKAAGKTGWVRMTALRLGDGTARKGDSGVGSALQFLSSGRSGSSGVTVATGVRGLDSADMTNAVPDPKAVDSLDKVAVSAADARQFAAQAKLSSHKIAYIPEPQPEKRTQPARPSNSDSILFGD